MLNYIDHDRDLGVLRAALHRRAVLGAAAVPPGDIIFGAIVIAVLAAVNMVGVKESAGVNVLLAVIDFMTQLLLVLVGAVLVLSPEMLADNIAPRRGADVERLRAGDPDRHDRLHRHRDDLEHGRGGRATRRKTIPAAIKRVLIAVFAIYFTLPAVALSALPVERDAATGEYSRCSGCPRTRAATPATRSSASSSRSTSGRSRRPASSTSASSRRRSCSSPPTRR